MLRATFSNLRARKMRLLMSAMAIILGTAFVAGSLMFTDALSKTFDGITEGSVGDVVVQPKQVDENFSASSGTIPAADVKKYAELPGVARADGNIDANGVFVVGTNGKVVGGQGAPAFAFNFNDAPSQNGTTALTVVEGRAPKGDEVAIDKTTVERSGHKIGDEVTFVSVGETPKFTAKLVGIVEFGEGGLAGASISVFDTPTMQKYFAGGKDTYNSIWLTTEEGATQEEIVKAAEPLVPDGFRARTGKDVAKETQDSIQQAMSFITTFLLVFAGIALFVGSFLIINTFSILVAQRGRELALLRAIGASRRQVTRSVLLEALVVGLVGSTLGLLLGVLLAEGIKALFGTFGLDLSGSGLTVRPRTVIAVYVVGLLVTMLAAWIPARKAGKVAPVAAMRDSVVEESSTARPIRFALEVGVLLLGAALFLVGLFVADSREIWWIGAGIVGLVLGVAFLAPVVGRPVIALLGLVYRKVFGSVGHMAEQNAVRNPGRTAATASALMIGMTLVALMGVVSQSTKVSIDKEIEATFRADFILSNAIGQPFSSKVSEEAAQVDGVRAVSPVRFVPATVDGGKMFATAIDPGTYGDVEKIETTDGSMADLEDGSVIANEKHHDGRKVGDTVSVELGAQKQDFTIAGFFEESQVMGKPDLIFTTDAVEKLGAPSADNWAFLFLDEGADKGQVQQGVDALVKDQPLVTLKDQESYADQQRASVNQLLYLIYALLGLAIIIAVLGIINTLGLSVMERTREIGLLRAVGLGRAQLRRMVRLESVTIALLGALLGIGLGVLAGVAIQRALVEDGITELAIPWVSLLVFVVMAGVIGVLAALLPARRAAKMDILEAIASE